MLFSYAVNACVRRELKGAWTLQDWGGQLATSFTWLMPSPVLNGQRTSVVHHPDGLPPTAEAEWNRDIVKAWDTEGVAQISYKRQTKP